MVSCHQLKRAPALTEEDLEAMQYLSKILLLRLTANACRPRWNSGLSKRSDDVPSYVQKLAIMKLLTDHVK